MAATRCNHMQVVAGVLQHLVHPSGIKALQVLPKLLAHLRCGGALFARGHLVVLAHVGVFQALQGSHRVIETSGGHAPRANRRTHQVHRLGRLRQPLAKQKPVKRPQDEPLGPTGCGGHHPDIGRLQAALGQVLVGQWAGVDSQCFHRADCRSAAARARRARASDQVVCGVGAHRPVDGVLLQHHVNVQAQHQADLARKRHCQFALREPGLAAPHAPGRQVDTPARGS